MQKLPEWTLLGEYCGVWDRQAPSTEAQEDDSGALDDPVGLGPLLRDKVSELGYTSKSAPSDAANGRPFPHVSTDSRSALCTKAWREAQRRGKPALRLRQSARTLP